MTDLTRRRNGEKEDQWEWERVVKGRITRDRHSRVMGGKEERKREGKDKVIHRKKTSLQEGQLTRRSQVTTQDSQTLGRGEPVAASRQPNCKPERG